MPRTLCLQKSELQNVNYLWLGAYRLRVDASDDYNTGADPNVFLYERGLENPYDSSVSDYFLGIASPVDMAEYPVGEPNVRTNYPFYRLPYVEIDLRSTKLANLAWDIIQERVTILLQGLDRLELLVPTTKICVGALPPGDTSGSSVSSSGSLSNSSSLSKS